SRRRHTRFSRDWSSDVCSSDLFVRILNDFEPYGTGNPQPIFYSKNVYDAGGYTKIVANNHLKLFLSQPHYKYGPGFPAFAYNSRSEERRVGTECEFRGAWYG